MSQYIPELAGEPPPPPPTPLLQPADAGPAAESRPSTKGSVQDYWDFGHADFMPQATTIDHDFGELKRLEGRQNRRSVAIWIGLSVLAAALLYGGYDLVLNDHNPIDALLAMFEDPEDPSPPHPAAQPTKQPALAAGATPTVAKPTDALKVVKDNPYWSLPNPTPALSSPLGRDWTQDEEDALRASLEHRFRYQHYKTVRTIQAKRLAGSESLLWIALKDKGFWVRMYAAVTLAEFAAELPLKELEQAIGDARSDLIANFLERFTRKPNSGQLYLMRQIVRLLDEQGRLVALRGINRSKGDLRDLYLMAATLDPGRRIKAWVKTALQEHRVEAKRQAQLLAVIRGEASPQLIWRDSPPPTPAVRPSKDRPAENVMSDDELEKQLDDMDSDPANVQVFHEQPAAKQAVKAVDDTPAGATFDYDQ